MNTTTRAQRINARQDKIWERAKAASDEMSEWRYVVNVGPTKAKIVEFDGTSVMDVINTPHASDFEKTIKQMVRARNCHDVLVDACQAALKARFEVLPRYDSTADNDPLIIKLRAALAKASQP